MFQKPQSHFDKSELSVQTEVSWLNTEPVSDLGPHTEEACIRSEKIRLPVACAVHNVKTKKIGVI